METTYESSTVEMGRDGFDDLQSQLLNNKAEKTAAPQDIRKEPIKEREDRKSVV